MFSMINPNWTNFIIDKPPTIYSLLEAIVNYGKDEKTKIKDLAKAGRSTIFNFDYPLSNKINKQDFETMILNNFIDRRIAYETLTTFRIKLNVKLNEIMPVYNKMFEMLDGWDIFSSGEQITRNISDSRNINSTSTQDVDATITGSENVDSTITQTDDIDATITNSNQSSNSVQNSSQTSASSTKDARKSDTPQSELSDVRDGSYVSDYEYTTNNSTGTDSSTGSASSTSSATNVEDRTVESSNVEDRTVNSQKNEDRTIENTSETTNQGTMIETITKTPSDKLKLYTEFIEKKNHIYSMIFKELDCLFYQLV